MLKKFLSRNHPISAGLSMGFTTSTTPYDLCVIGGGPGGYVAAIKAAQLGLKTVCVEKRGALGGTCLNVGCIPSKALLNISHKYEEAHHQFNDLGIQIEGLSYNFSKVMKNKEKIVSGLTKGIEGLFKKNGVDYVAGYGSFSSKDVVNVSLNKGGNQEVRAKNFIIATGSDATLIPSLPCDEKIFMTSTGALSLDKVPKKLIVIGAGVIGLELGSVYQRFGSEVEVVEYLDRIVPPMDIEAGGYLARSLKKQKMSFRLKTKVISGSIVGDHAEVIVEGRDDKKQEKLSADAVLIAIGRRPYTDKLGLENAGVKLDDRGRVHINDHFQTNVPNIYAIGDVVKGAMLAHKAEEEGVALAETLAGKYGHVNYDAIPSVIYTHPEVAWVGKTEEELKEAKIEYKKGVFQFIANSRARTNLDSEGLVKLLADKTTDKILGAHIVGPNAGELIQECVLGIEYGASSEDIARTCHAHPTLSEAIKEAALATHFKPIHM